MRIRYHRKDNLMESVKPFQTSLGLVKVVLNLLDMSFALYLANAEFEAPVLNVTVGTKSLQVLQTAAKYKLAELGATGLEREIRMRKGI